MKTRHKIVGSAENRKLNPIRSFLYLKFSFPKKLSIYHSLLFNDNEIFICTFCPRLRLFKPVISPGSTDGKLYLSMIFCSPPLPWYQLGLGGLFHRRRPLRHSNPCRQASYCSLAVKWAQLLITYVAATCPKHPRSEVLAQRLLALLTSTTVY